jgi:hypothetical protein
MHLLNFSKKNLCTVLKRVMQRVDQGSKVMILGSGEGMEGH